MTVELTILISVISLVFGLYVGLFNISRNKRTDTQSDAAQLTTVIVKLENIGLGITEIKSEMSSVKKDISENKAKWIELETKMKICEKHCGLFGDDSK